MGFALVNLSALPSDTIREIVEFARGRISSRGVTVIVREFNPGENKGHWPFFGLFQPGARLWDCSDNGTTTQAIELVISRVLRRRKHAGVGIRGKRVMIYRGWRETLLHLAAHEWWHRREWTIWRKLKPRPKLVGYRQRDADRYADGRLAEWRARRRRP